MQRYFLNEEDFLNRRINEIHHIKNVMRMSIDDLVIVVYEKAYLCVLKELSDYAYFEIVKELESDCELDLDVTIIQGYPKGDKTEDIIMHNTELGCHDFLIAFMKRSIVKLDNKKIEAKEIRYQKIAKEASEQSHRIHVPNVKIMDLRKIDFSIYDLILVAYELSSDYNSLKEKVKNLLPNQKIAIVVGPEGGIDEDEIKFLSEKNAVFVSLGKRILRTENAANFLMSIISYEREL